MVERTDCSDGVVQLRHRFKNDLQVILGLGRLGDLDELISYVKAIAPRYLSGPTELAADHFWPFLISNVRELMEAGLDCRIEVREWLRLPPPDVKAIADLQRVFEQIIANYCQDATVRLRLSGGGSAVTVTVEGTSGKVLEEHLILVGQP